MFNKQRQLSKCKLVNKVIYNRLNKYLRGKLRFVPAFIVNNNLDATHYRCSPSLSLYRIEPTKTKQLTLKSGRQMKLLCYTGDNDVYPLNISAYSMKGPLNEN